MTRPGRLRHDAVFRLASPSRQIMARSRSRMRPKSTAHAFQSLAAVREAVPSHRDGTPLVRVQTLGATRIQIGTSQLNLQAGLLFPLVLRLIYSSGMEVQRDALLRELWPLHDEARRRGNLRQALYKLRSMGFDVDSTDSMVQLNPSQVLPMFCVAPSIESLERDIIRGEEPLGPFAPGLLPSSDAHEEWLDQTRSRLHADVRRVLVEQLRARRDRADWGGAEVISRWVLLYDSLNEDATLTLAECAMLNGSKAEAIAILDRYLEELGPNAEDIRLPATQLRRRFTDPSAKRRPSLAITERHFVGRQQELAELTLAMRRARWHDGSAVLLHGPPGIGKTRVLAEVSKVAQIEGFREIAIECRESDQRRPLGVFLDVIPELLNMPGALGCSPESLATLKLLVGDSVLRHEIERDRQQAFADTVADQSLVLPPERARVRSVRRALVDVVGAISEERPVYLAIEDLHWIDSDSWECFADLVQRSSSMRVFIATSSRFRFAQSDRPSRFPALLTPREMIALADEYSISLARKISADCSATIPTHTEAWFIAAGEGNPLMIRSLVHHWVESGTAGGIPPTLEALLEQRVERLHEHALRAIQAIVLLGRLATPERVRAVLELPTHELLGALENLSNGDCLRQTDDVFFVAHELIGRAAVRRLPRLIQTTLHSAISDLLLTEIASDFDVDIVIEACEHLLEANRGSEVHGLLVAHGVEFSSSGSPSRVLRCIELLSQRLPERADDSALLRLKSRVELEIGEYGRSLMSTPSVPIPTDLSTLQNEDLDQLVSSIDSASRADALVDRAELAELAASISGLSSALPSIRLRASEVGLTIAANTCNSSIAFRCFENCAILNTAGVGTAKLDRHALLFHTIFGELEIAASMARRYVIEFEHSRSSTSDAHDLARAAYSLRVYGDLHTSKAAFLSAYQSLIALAAPRLAEFAAWQLAQIAIDEGNHEQLTYWNDKLQRLLDSNDDVVSAGYAKAHFCRDAIFRGDKEAALELHSELRASLPRVPTPKASAYLLALELGVSLLSARWRPSDDLLSVAIDRHRQTAAFGTSDYFTLVLAEGLMRNERASEARELITTYFSSIRRERSAPIAPLAQLRRKLSV